MADTRITPTLFDKLVSGLELDGLAEGERSDRAVTEMNRSTLRFYTVPKLERFNEAALTNTVKRELNWLLNTTQLGAVVDLEPYPEVATSVLNYGVPDLAGKSMERRLVQRRAREIRDAIRAFEPRLNPKQLEVEPAAEGSQRDNAITFVIRGDVVSAVQALPVEFKTDVDADSGAATVRG